jgi:hypothetical protein
MLEPKLNANWNEPNNSDVCYSVPISPSARRTVATVARSVMRVIVGVLMAKEISYWKLR